MLQIHKLWVVVGGLLLLCGVGPSALAVEQAEHMHPQQVVESAINEVRATIQQNRARIEQDDTFFLQQIEKYIERYMDFSAMSKLVLGKHWRTASVGQREQFQQQFKRLLVRTYKTSMSEYSDEKIELLPFRASSQPHKRAVVKSAIQRSNGPAVPISYSLRFKESDGWKVYDIGIEGISLITSYRSSFSRDISEKGIDYLIERLKERNSDVASAGSTTG